MTPAPARACHAIVLAAGESRRMGRPKALLDVGGIPLVRRHAIRFAEAGCDPVLVATRSELVEAVREALRDLPSCTMLPARTASQAETLRVATAALRALGARDDAVVLVTPIDLLPPAGNVLDRLARAIADGAEAATPNHGGRGGHPIAMRATSLFRFASDPRATTLREHLAALGRARAFVDVDDERVLGDFDHAHQVEP